MDITQDVEGRFLTLRIAGDFDTTDTEGFSAAIESAIDGGIYLVALDLTGLEFINSTALGSLLRAQKWLAQYGGGMCAFGPRPGVDRTFRVLELDRRIPLFEDGDQARAHLESLSPEQVSGGGEELEFRLPGGDERFSGTSRVGRLEKMHETGLSFTFENLDRVDPEQVFATGRDVRLDFKLPLYHQSHVFRVAGEVEGQEQLGPETILVHVKFTEISEKEMMAVRQYVKDLRFLGDEV